jgi:biopolymer transport protein ExbB
MNLKRWRRMAAFLPGVACAAFVLLMMAGAPALAQPETGAATEPAATAEPGTEAAAPATEPGAEAVPGAEALPGEEAATEPTPPPEIVATEEEVENPYGFGKLLKEGDWVSKTVLGILLIMSVGTWYLFFSKYLEQGRVMKHARTADNRFWRASSVKDGISQLEGGSAFRAIVEDGQKAVQEHSSLAGQIAMNEWVSMALNRSVDIVSNRLQGGLAFLASVGSTAPFVGLFGTVWGIYHALIKIGVSGQASIDQVAGPVGEALIMTALGLAVAVPAVLIYNMLVRRNRVIMERVRGFASDVHGFLLSGARGAKRG